MTQADTPDLEMMAKALEQSGDYRVLRRLVSKDVYLLVPPDQATKIGLLIDFETTGLDTATCEVIEIGMVKFAYTADGRVAHVIDRFGSLNQPISPIPAEATKYNHITNEMVAGHLIAAAAVSVFIADANIVIAHNAKFDRKFAERYWPEFEQKGWACSQAEIDWSAHGFEGTRLAYLLAGAGFFHTAHRAVDDCNALLEVLAMPLGQTGKSALGHLLDNARRTTVRVWAIGAPIELKDTLKKRGYRWNDGSDGRPKSWYFDVDEARVETEIAYLQADPHRPHVRSKTDKITARERYSVRS